MKVFPYNICQIYLSTRENMKNQELTINWHITEACNYSCRYCFAKWNKNGKELLHSSASIEALMREIAKLPMLLNRYRGTDPFEFSRWGAIIIQGTDDADYSCGSKSWICFVYGI